MAKKRDRADKARPDKSAAPRAKVARKLDETLAELERIKQDTSGSQVRLRADLARDSVEEFSREVSQQLRRLANDKRKLKKQGAELRGRLVELLHDLSTGPVILPRAPGRPAVEHDQLLATYRQLRAKDFLEMAQTIQTAAGKGDVPAYQRYLVNEMLVNGSHFLVENIVRHAGADWPTSEEEAFLGRLRHHLAGTVCSELARRVGYQVTPEVGEHLDGLLNVVLHFLTDLLTATPPGRLLVPRDGSPFDPQQHEAASGRPAEGNLKVKATLFPGFVVLDTPPRILEKAQVYTERVAPATLIAPPPAEEEPA